MVVIDTNIIIDHLRKYSETSALENIAMKFDSSELAISEITIQELYAGKSTLKKDIENEMLLTISPLERIPYNEAIAKIAGEITRDLTQLISFADAAIAATCIYSDSELFTLNTKDFSKIKSLKLISLS